MEARLAGAKKAELRGPRALEVRGPGAGLFWASVSPGGKHISGIHGHCVNQQINHIIGELFPFLISHVTDLSLKQSHHLKETKNHTIICKALNLSKARFT